MTSAITTKQKPAELQNLKFIVHKSPAINLKILQQLTGKWESISQMCFFAKGVRWLLQNVMKQFGDDEDVILKIPGRVKDDMKIWAAITKAAKGGLPIPPPTTGPPLNHLVFVSDAAGRRPAGSRDETGVASVGICKEKTWFGCQIFWQTKFT
jgi:hypothetical protein